MTKAGSKMPFTKGLFVYACNNQSNNNLDLFRTTSFSQEEYIETLYYALLNRLPDANGKKSYLSFADSLNKDDFFKYAYTCIKNSDERKLKNTFSMNNYFEE